MMAVDDDNDTIENTLAFDEDTGASSSTEQDIQDLSGTDILNNAFMKIANSCQNLLSAHLDLIELFPYDENNEDEDNGEIKSPYNEAIIRHLLFLIREDVDKFVKYTHNIALKNSVRKRLNDINNDISEFNNHIVTNDLNEYLIEFNKMMGISNK